MELESPTKKGGSRYEEYFTIEGKRKVTQLASAVEYSKMGARPKTNVQDCLGPAVNDEHMLVDQVLEAEQRAERELQICLRQREEDLREQEHRQWEDEARKREEAKAKIEAKQEKKKVVFRDTAKYQENKEEMARCSILKDPLPTGFHKLRPKEPEVKGTVKKGHRSNSKSPG